MIEQNNGKAARLAELSRLGGTGILNMRERRELARLRDEDKEAQAEAVRVLKESMEAK